jgi:HK97 family phage portal protein
MFDKVLRRLGYVPKSALRASERKSIGNTFMSLYPYGDVGANWSSMNNFGAYLTEGYELNSCVYFCINLVANTAARVPWKLINMKTAEEIEDHPILTIMDRPNVMQGWSGILQYAITDYLLAGRSFINLYGAPNRPATEMYVLRPDYVIQQYNDFREPYFLYSGGADEAAQSIGLNQMVFLQCTNPRRTINGLSPLRPGARSIDLNNKGREWNNNLLQNGAKLSGVFTTPPDARLDDATYKRLKSELTDNYQGARNAGKSILLTDGTTFTPLELTPAEISWLDGLNLSAREICAIFGVPPVLYGDTELAKYSNYETARLSLYTETVVPLVDYIADELNHTFVPQYGDDLELQPCWDACEALAPVRKNQEDFRSSIWTRASVAYKSGLITLNEAREEAGLEPTPAGDEFAKPQMTPFTEPVPEAGTVKKNACGCGLEHKTLPAMSPHEVSLAATMDEFFSQQLHEGVDNLNKAIDG